MMSLSQGAIDQIMNGVEVEKPILQILGIKKLASSNTTERYRLLISDGEQINSFAMLATQLNCLVTDNIITDFCICQINRYAMSTVNSGGKQKRIMVILSLDVKAGGDEVGCKIGTPINSDQVADSGTEADSNKAQSVQNLSSNVVQRTNIKQSMSSEISTISINALSPYHSRWVIRARVTNKSGIREWSNSRGSGKLFSMDLADKDGEIRCTGFNNQCDKFYDMIEIGKIYYISRCTLKPSNKRFSNLNHNYEMNMTNDTEIIPCDEDPDLPTIQFNFSLISDLEQKENNEIIDVLGIVINCGEIMKLKAKTTGKDLIKRDINLVDESENAVTLSLWGSDAEKFPTDERPIVAIKGARIVDFNGRNLSTLSSSVIHINPDIPEAHKLRGWANSIDLETVKFKSASTTVTNNKFTGAWMTLEQAGVLGKVGDGRLQAAFAAKVTVTMVRVQNAVYKSCITDGCKKKLIDQANEMYRCEKCNKEFPTFKYRLLAGFSVSDWTGSIWATAFNDEAEKILDASAQELGEIQDTPAYFDKFKDACFMTYVMQFRAREDTYNDEQRIKVTCMSVQPVDYEAYNKILFTKIKEMRGVQTEKEDKKVYTH